MILRFFNFFSIFHLLSMFLEYIIKIIVFFPYIFWFKLLNCIHWAIDNWINLLIISIISVTKVSILDFGSIILLIFIIYCSNYYPDYFSSFKLEWYWIKIHIYIFVMICDDYLFHNQPKSQEVICFFNNYIIIFLLYKYNLWILY